MNAYTLIVVVMLQWPHVAIQDIPFATKEACEGAKAALLNLPQLHPRPLPDPKQLFGKVAPPDIPANKRPFLHMTCHMTGAPTP